ncbi:amidohydrolase family protein [Litoreibacter roseus]|uniref:Hydrolase n=1 Tax=Litoreibacter roseus TaxID=2601869 RepID=A0A6N6JC66_9RHOB|nr:amidohydrolase family protein [Litoreibacter roseus]GFE63674.1 hydrolase [Litoreibacter roseus]
MIRIDAHQHYWNPARGDYDWMPKENSTLNRPYGPDDLAPALGKHGIDGTVVVQAAATVEETEYMLGLADATPSILGVVGWIDFENRDHRRHLERLSQHPKFLGVRPMIQDIPDVDWMLRDDVQWAYDALIDLDLTFDALGFPRHLANFLTIAIRYPKLRIVYDHCMKPQIRDQMAGLDAMTDWAAGITRLANETSGVCKFSALVTEADDGWSSEDIQPFAAHVIDAFGADRIMWGSDWPVCRLQAEYDDWRGMAEDFVSHLSAEDQAQIFGGTAARFYGLT